MTLGRRQLHLRRRRDDALEQLPNRWTQRVLARNADDEPVQPNDPSAVCFCAIGAMYRAAEQDPPIYGLLPVGPGNETEYGKLMAAARAVADGRPNDYLQGNADTAFLIYDVNDNEDGGREQVLELFRKAIDNV